MKFVITRTSNYSDKMPIDGCVGDEVEVADFRVLDVGETPAPERKVLETGRWGFADSGRNYVKYAKPMMRWTYDISTIDGLLAFADASKDAVILRRGYDGDDKVERDGDWVLEIYDSYRE